MSTGFTPNADLSRLRIADSVKVACLRKPLNCSRESPRRKAMAGSALAGGNPLATPRKFMDSFYTLNNDYFNEMDQGATQAAAKLNITESREINNADVNVQKGHIENAPNLGIDGITMVAATEGSEVDLLRLAGGLAATQALGADSGKPI